MSGDNVRKRRLISTEAQIRILKNLFQTFIEMFIRNEAIK